MKSILITAAAAMLAIGCAGSGTGVAPAPAPERWDAVIGEYAWRDTTVFLRESRGRLELLIPGMAREELERAGGDSVFTSSGGDIRIHRSPDGTVTGMTWQGVQGTRRHLGPESGGQLRIAPLHPVDSLIAAAIGMEVPPELAAAAGEDVLAPDLVPVTTFDSTIRLEIRYATTNNFLSTVFYDTAAAWLQRPAARALARASESLREEGYGLLVFDGYRPWFVTKAFWDATPDSLRWLVANPAHGSRHNRGSAVDITLYDLSTGRPVEMTGTYDEATSRSRANYPGGTSRERWHRDLLRRAMEREGFEVIESEWWHFDYKDWERYPVLNVPFDRLDVTAQ